MAVPFNRKQFLAALETASQFELPVIATVTAQFQGRSGIEKAIAHLRQYLDSFERHIETTAIPSYTFDLSNPVNVGEMISYKLGQQGRHDLVALPRFYGAGVYMLYYNGLFEAYEAIRGTVCPIYVGAASPKNKIADTPKTQGLALHKRLTHHLNGSIVYAKSTLDPAHFSCRYIVVQSGLELAAEQFLLRRYRPVWNKDVRVCPGFGKHGDKADRQSELSKWDILHPGRPFAKGQSVKKKPKSLVSVTAGTLKTDIETHFQKLLRDQPETWRDRFNIAWVEKQAGH